MVLKLKITSDNIILHLNEKDKIIDSLSFPLDHNLSEKLLISIDEILGKNQVNLEKLEKVDFSSEIKDSYTSARIGQVVADSLNWAIRKNKK